MIVATALVLALLAAAAFAQAGSDASAVPPAAAAPRDSGGAQTPSRELIEEIPVRAAFVVRDGEPRPLDAEPPHPGEVVGLILEWPEGARVPLALVAPGAQLGQAIPLELVSGDPRADGGDVLEVLLVGLGEVEIPAFLLRSREDGKTFMSAAVKLEVVSSLAEDDTEPSPSRGQAGIGLNRLGVAFWILIALLITGAVLFWWLRRRKRPRPEPRIDVPGIPAGVWARRALDRLLASGLLESGEIKVFHVRLAAISKEYLSRQFGVHLMERTTAECPGDLHAAGVEEPVCNEVGEWLAQIDLVKFAGENPGQREIDTSVNALRMMIENTRPPAAATATEHAPAAAAEGVAG